LKKKIKKFLNGVMESFYQNFQIFKFLIFTTKLSSFIYLVLHLLSLFDSINQFSFSSVIEHKPENLHIIALLHINNILFIMTLTCIIKQPHPFGLSCHLEDQSIILFKNKKKKSLKYSYK